MDNSNNSTGQSKEFYLEYLPHFAEFILKNHLHEFAASLLQASKNEDIPLLKLFAHLSDDELIDLGKKSSAQLLTVMIENKIAGHITNSTQEWINNKIPSIEREEVTAEDITLVSLARHKVFRNFLWKYTSDQNTFNNVMDDLDRFVALSETASFNAYIFIQQEKLNLANQKLESQYKELKSFNYAASHDLQEPLRKIRTFTDRIVYKNKDKLEDEVLNDLEKIKSSSERMQNLISDLLNFSQSTSALYDFKDVDLNQVLNDALNTLSNIIEEEKAEIKSQQLPIIFAVPFQFQQVFTNLISNSLKYKKAGSIPKISIKWSLVNAGKLPVKNISLPKKYLCITVKDNGIGFEKEYEDKIFDLFTRLHNKEKYPGTGIGLALCKKIIENHNGFIKAESDSPNGASFQIYLPAEIIISS